MWILFVVILGASGIEKAEAEAVQPLAEKPCACKAAARQILTFP